MPACLECRSAMLPSLISVLLPSGGSWLGSVLCAATKVSPPRQIYSHICFAGAPAALKHDVVVLQNLTLPTQGLAAVSGNRS